MNRKKITIGLFGFGCVGYGLYEVLEKTPGLNATIKKICVKDRHKQRKLPAERFTFNKDELINDEEINVIVELIDDADEAYSIAVMAMNKGKAVVSANKKMIATHFNELLEMQQKNHVALLYEAACCASIPIIRNLEEYYDNDMLESVEGIVNGSTNYILTKTNTEKISFTEALRQAQEKGYAESNPTLDTGGFDARFKLQLLLAHAFGLAVKPEQLFTIGIEQLGDLEFNYAREKGLKIKLVAFASRSGNGGIKAYVLPTFIGKHNKLFSVDDVFNGITTKSAFSDIQFFSGKGAGAHPTASAVLSDISALSYDYRYAYRKLTNTETLSPEEDVYLEVLLRYNDNPENLRHRFVSIKEHYSAQHAGYLIGIITLERLRALFNTTNEPLSCVLIENIEAHKMELQENLAAVEWR